MVDTIWGMSAPSDPGHTGWRRWLNGMWPSLSCVSLTTFIATLLCTYLSSSSSMLLCLSPGPCPSSPSMSSATPRRPANGESSESEEDEDRARYFRSARPLASLSENTGRPASL